MYSFLGNNEIDDLMKKYDAIDKATGSSVDEFMEISNDNSSVADIMGIPADKTETDDFTEVPVEKTEAVDFTEVPTEKAEADEFTEVPVEKAEADDFTEVPVDKTGSDEFMEVESDNSTSADEFMEVKPGIDRDDDFREIVDGHLMLDPSIPSYIPKIDINGTGLVLAGGGGKGIYQVGMLKVLNEAGVLDDVVGISGTSIGAVNTILYAMGVDKMEKVWDEIDMSTLFDFDEKQIASGNTHFSRSEMNNLIEKYLDYNDIRNEKRVLFAGTSKCAANFSELDPTYGCTARYFMFNGATDDDIRSYMLASTALPYIYSPVRIGTDRYLDGGINDNIPIRPLYDLGIRKFIVIELSPVSKFKPSEFPGAEFISIVPSHDLGDLFTGTLNFENKDKRFKKELGERDGKIYVKTKFEKDETYIAIEQTLLTMEYNAMVNEQAHMEQQIKLENSVNSNLDKFNSIANKYGANIWDD